MVFLAALSEYDQVLVESKDDVRCGSPFSSEVLPVSGPPLTTLSTFSEPAEGESGSVRDHHVLQVVSGVLHHPLSEQEGLARRENRNVSLG